MNKSFVRSGHLPTLFASFLYFDASFTVWVLLGPLGVQIGKALSLDPAQKGLLVALPVLSGALLRLATGLAADRIGGRLAAILAQVVVIAGLVAAWRFGLPSFAAAEALGLLLGVAGASFAIALPLASRWYPPPYQGFALGLAGAGNIGTVFTALAAPGLAAAFGFRNVFGLAALFMVAVLVVFSLTARDAPNQPAPLTLARYFAVLRLADTWWLMLFYGVTFGGFVGLAASLVIYLHTQYGLGPVDAGYLTALASFVGASCRPIGGAIADRIGGIRSLGIYYLVAAAALTVTSFGIPNLWIAMAAILTTMLACGLGDGAVFQLVPLRFAREIGVVTGIVGMAGGVGGFYLASSLGLARQLTGSYQAGFLFYAALALVAFAALSLVKRRWRAALPVAALGAVPVRV